MKLFARRPESELREQLAQVGDKKVLLAKAVLALLHCIKELSFDLTEVGSDALKEQVDELARVVRADELSPRVGEELEGGRERILDYADRARGYLREREGEWKRIVELLNAGLRELGAEDKAYNQRIYQGSMRLEQLSHLNDIKLVRQKLQTEIGQLKTAVREKEAQDAERFQKLNREVEALRTDVERAKSDALRDALTGAGNRAAFDQTLQLMVDRNAVGPSPFSLLLVDVDHFKQINDTYGHPVGDRVLIALVQACREQVRRDDFIGRYGGEEFAILLPTASARIAYAKARALVKSQAKRKYAVEGRGHISFTVSVGVAAYQPGDTVATLLERADKALYEGKRRGRNRAVILR